MISLIQKETAPIVEQLNQVDNLSMQIIKFIMPSSPNVECTIHQGMGYITNMISTFTATRVFLRCMYATSLMQEQILISIWEAFSCMSTEITSISMLPVNQEQCQLKM